MSKQNPIVIIIVAVAIAYAIWMVPKLAEHKPVKNFEDLQKFYAALEAGHFSELKIIDQERIEGKFAQKATTHYDKNYDKFVVDVVLDAERVDHIVSERAPEGTKIKIQHAMWTDRLLQVAGNIVLPLIILVFLLLFLRQMRAGSGQAMSFGKNKAQLLGDNFEKVTFDDVAGMEEVKEELQEVVQFLKYPEKFRALGAQIPHGVLLVGPPGCGKTLLARAVAGEADCAFFYISGSDFVEMFVGVGASRVRDLFEQAKEHLPAIVFIDELDAVGRLRGAGVGGGHDEREQTLNALLVEMDGFDPNADIVILAATNRPDVLDPALLRPGRFDRRVVVHNPDVKEREAILRIYADDKPLAEGVDVETLAKRTPGFSGADLENLVNEAALLAARDSKDQIEMEDFDEAVDRVIAGPERRSRIIREKEKKILAYHESGHALVGYMLPEFDKTYKVTILPRGMAMGYTINLPDDDKRLLTRQEMLDQATQALGGRAAEELVFEDVSNGAANDLEKVSDLVRKMVTEYGMSDELGPLTYGKKQGPVFLGKEIAEERNYSEDVAEVIDSEIRRFVYEAYDRAKQILTENRDKLDKLVELLLVMETLDREQLSSVIETGELPEKEEEEEEKAQEEGEEEELAAEDEEEVASESPQSDLTGPPMPEPESP